MFNCVQACEGFLHLLRDNEAAGVAFCDQLVQQAHNNPGGALGQDTLLLLLHQLVEYLLKCELVAQDARQGGNAGDGVNSVPLILLGPSNWTPARFGCGSECSRFWLANSEEL
jgi:hypothetical protein